jgi:hypothetical protein
LAIIKIKIEMTAIKYIITVIIAGSLLVACEKKDYPAGVEEMEHHYYAVFVPNNNTGVSVFRTQTTLIKFPVQFYSTFERGYDAVAKYAILDTGIANKAVVGVDFDIVDKDGNTIPSTDGEYSLVFPNAIQAMDTIYVKLLNNPTPGIRKMEIHIQENQTNEFYVDKFSTAFRRPVEIK